MLGIDELFVMLAGAQRHDFKECNTYVEYVARRKSEGLSVRVREMQNAPDRLRQRGVVYMRIRFLRGTPCNLARYTYISRLKRTGDGSGETGMMTFIGNTLLVFTYHTVPTSYPFGLSNVVRYCSLYVDIERVHMTGWNISDYLWTLV